MDKEEIIRLLMEALTVLKKEEDEPERAKVRQMLIAKLNTL